MTGSDELLRRSGHLLAHARFMTLATTDGSEPWASTVNFVPLRAPGTPLRLLYYSLRTALHSRNIDRHPRVAGSLYLTGLPGLGLDGAQFTGTCRATDDQGVAEHHRLYYELNFPDPAVRSEWLLPASDFRGPGPRRFYTVEVDRWWLLDIDRWLVDKHDQRVEVPLHDLTEPG
ncbi:pyridoxamine 5'-phosphate oxidase family protein [Kitasatospora sp. NPDC056783]|uniref:pyridoxamine 5'-phosphate oxidase family protein n=1 Tax=Kitasatospora sp. NPDC056783 TaxID=3345943 RepID=UPI00368AEE46